MLITAIEPRKRSFSALYIDGEFALKLDTQTLIENRITAGAEITDEQLKELIDKSNERRAKEKALWLISYRDRSKKELIDKIKPEYGLEAAQNAADRMEELGLVDDEKYARRLCEELINKKHMSKTAVSYKLREKGIDRSLIEQLLCELEVDPAEQIQALLEGKYRNKLYDEKSRKRTFAALQRMGYRWSDIKPVMDSYITDDEEEYI
ncbi:MAG: regulatory protein RecX [Acutalibacteraceae bacterium]